MKKVILSLMVVGTLLATGCKKAAEAGKDMKDATLEAANKAADATKDAATTVVDGAKEAADKAVDATKDAANTVVEGAKDATNKAVDATKDAVDATKDAANAVVDGAKDATSKAGDAINSAIGGVSIPKFENPEVTKHLESYAEYAKDYAANKGDALKKAKLVTKGAALATKGKELLGTLDAASATKFKSVMTAIQSTMK